MSLKAKAAVFKKLRYRLFLYLLIALIFAMPARTALEHHFLYFPDPRYEATPTTVGLTYEEIAFQATDGTRLNGWLLPGESEARLCSSAWAMPATFRIDWRPCNFSTIWVLQFLSLIIGAMA